MGPGSSLLLVAVLLAPAAARGAAAGARHVVTFAPGGGAAVETQLRELGLTVAARGAGFFAVEPAAPSPYAAGKEAAHAAARDDMAARLLSLDGVTGAEADHAAPSWDGNLTDASAAAGAAFTAGGWSLADAQRAAPADKDCSQLDRSLGYGAFPEVEAYHIKQTQSDSAKLQKEVPTTADRGVLVCVIDSGIDMGHPEFAAGSATAVDGCKEEDADAPAGCPFKWSQDLTGHGSHVSGIIGAPRNGLGIVGVIPEGANIYMVRIFNDSGDVNQGQGYVYGSSLILAYTQCEGKLAYLQASQPDRKWRMVINMSVGAPGPLTIEKLFFREATARPDMLFVASSGNNGTDPYQWLNFPSAYEDVVSVGAVDCNNRVQPWSQKNARVDIVAPGANILSSYPIAKSAEAGSMQGFFAFGPVSLNAAPAAIASGTGEFRGALADCGGGTKPCPAAKGAVCVVQSEPRRKRAPDSSSYLELPSTCDLIKFCVQNGAKAVVLVPPREVPNFGAYPPDLITAPMLDCTAGGQVPCPCWSGAAANGTKAGGGWPGLVGLKRAGIMPPVVALSINQLDKVRKEAAALKRGGKPGSAFIKARPYPYRRMSGTSMATPVVSGIAARVWAAFPECTAQELKRALYNSAKDLGGKGWDKDFGWGLVQAEAAFDYLQRLECGGGPGAEDRTEPETAATWRPDANAMPVVVPEGKAPKLAAAPGRTWAAKQQQQEPLPLAAAAAVTPPARGGGGGGEGGQAKAAGKPSSPAAAAAAKPGAGR